MRKLFGLAFLAATLLTGVPAFAGQISIGIHIGPPPRPRIVRSVPRQPGPDYLWIEGYWYPSGRKYQWHDGYWTRPPYPGARWTGARYDRDTFMEGYWSGDRGRFEHNHQWDRDKKTRDSGRDRDDNQRGRGRGNQTEQGGDGRDRDGGQNDQGGRGGDRPDRR